MATIKKRLIVLNGDQYRSMEDIQTFLQKALAFPDFYGKNLDALWDCLRSAAGPPIRLIWINFHASQSHLGERANALQLLFTEAQAELKNFEFVVKP